MEKLILRYVGVYAKITMRIREYMVYHSTQLQLRRAKDGNRLPHNTDLDCDTHSYFTVNAIYLQGNND